MMETQARLAGQLFDQMFVEQQLAPTANVDRFVGCHSLWGQIQCQVQQFDQQDQLQWPQ